ncbi:hypothetical protein DAPPUDRAFT_265179 [Daphnia pulex]|uniref:Reverse transcriptase domain-containing protein n=1 Tax=Daphnia pulex TaxID=6669 RepID=E9HT01_DAPPU|nr:hypothetical protein DAPPUDRAFT_265179 [Daphnia pulex]|eukprot:EFX65129.1 hypothetical protein DAPPUDRAFT_265179 [Daphnia pulex]
MKSVRGLEEMRTGSRRHEANIQLLTTQLGDFRLQVQDQMNSIRTHFSQTVNEFYQKIVERQNSMGYRLSSVVDELSAVKSKVRNIPLQATAGASDQAGAADNDVPTESLWKPERSSEEIRGVLTTYCYIRICVDHTRLNKFVMRPTHPTRRTPREAVAEIDDDATFFSSFYAANGFYQIPLHPDSQHLTTLMTPWGRYRILRASMGLSCSSDKYNR